MRGWAANLRNAILRTLSLPSNSSRVRAISLGIRPIRRWLVLYLLRSPAARALARQFACRNAKPSPSPVTASTDPDASPTRATCPLMTDRSLADIEIAPRVGPNNCAPLRWLARAGNMSFRSDALLSLLLTTATHTSFVPTGVTYAWQSLRQ